MELKDYKELLKNIREELEKTMTNNVFLMPLQFIIMDISKSITNGYHEKPATYLFEGKFENNPYRLTLKFDENIGNIFAQSNYIGLLKSLRIEKI